ncbi:hypothetical protein NFI96_004649 [Prochilodus magdalenae]|nr:hypothetical protein NFI96_004649 [Prochilodus magdalenae]
MGGTSIRMVSVLSLLFLILLTPVKSHGRTVEGTSANLTCFHVETPETVKETQPAILTCRTTCNLTDPSFIWYKNGQLLTNKTNNQLHLQTVSREDAGSYSCAVVGYEHLRSTDQNLRVTYPPKNVLVSISPPGYIAGGSSVTLTCSSVANPPVDEYHWFKETLLVGKGKDYTISNISSETAGEYKCKCFSAEGHQYSAGVTVNLIGPPKNVSVSISPSGKIVEGSSVTLTCSSDGIPPVEIYTWFKGSTPVGNEQTYNIPNIRSEDSGEYTCQSRNEHGERRSAPMPINVLYPPKNVSVYISPSGDIAEDSSVTLTCSSDGNPPVKNYTWFKEGGASPVGSGHSYSITNITAEHTGLYSCEAQNELGRQMASAALSLYPEHSYTAVLVTVGLVCLAAVIIVCLVYLMIRRAKRRGQRALSSTPDGVPTMYAATEDAHVGLNATCSSFRDTRRALDNTYLLPADEPHSLDVLYAKTEKLVPHFANAQKLLDLSRNYGKVEHQHSQPSNEKRQRIREGDLRAQLHGCLVDCGTGMHCKLWISVYTGLLDDPRRAIGRGTGLALPPATGWFSVFSHYPNLKAT